MALKQQVAQHQYTPQVNEYGVPLRRNLRQPYQQPGQRPGAGSKNTPQSRDKTPVTNRPASSDLLEEEDEYDDVWPARIGSSAKRYATSQDNQIIQQGNRTFVMHPPVEPVQARSRFPLLLILASFLVCISAGMVIASYAPPMYHNWQNERTYGYPRTYQVDKNVGHGDPRYPISHFIALNNHTLIEVIEIPGGDPQKYPTRTYIVGKITGEGADLVPVTIDFIDANGDGKLDIEVFYNSTVWILTNDGTGFRLR